MGGMHTILNEFSIFIPATPKNKECRKWGVLADPAAPKIEIYPIWGALEVLAAPILEN